jgi:integrase/recombinase XerD
VLADYLERRKKVWENRPVSLYVFVSSLGNQLSGSEIRNTFYALSRQIELRGATDSRGPRLHDMRHTFASKTLLRWYRLGQGAEEQRLPILSTYLGHVHWRHTFWYLTAMPELMTEAMSRLERRWEAQS